MPTPTLTLYTTPTCPDCRALKVWLDRQGIPYDERDLTDPAVATEAKIRYGVRIAPITVLGDLFFFGTFADQRPQLQRLLADG
ncbi:glutaredoxin family protein [Deinococcus sp. YIM 134068]|uniref:Glutaredoxin family protein n=1 Tax=Deinococcus taklimakanensis TaxID=536443 RepID=A0ABW5P5M5_9DEIO